MAKKPRAMDAAAIAAWLSIDAARLDELLARGLPRRRDRSFDPLVVAKWLEREGLARRCDFAGVVATLGQVAEEFGVSIDTVKKEWRRSGMPGKPGHFDLAEIAAWKGLRSRDPGQPSAAAADRELQRRKLDAEIRNREADAERRERENRLALGDLLPRDVAERSMAQAVIAARNATEAIPREMMPRFPADIAHDLAEELARRLALALTSLSKWRPNHAD